MTVAEMAKFAEDKKWITFNVKETFHIFHVDENLYKFRSWGVEYARNISDRALFLKLNGRFYKYWIDITVDSSDTYTVTFFKRNNTVKAKFELIYDQQLVEVIDDLVQNIPGYLEESAKIYAQ